VPVPSPLPDPLVDLVAQRFRVLGEPARIKLLDALRSGPASVGELATRVGLSQQNASKHLGVLHSAGLVQRTRTGSTAQYAITDPSVFTLCEIVCDALRDRYSALQAVLPPPPAPVSH
jgi:DNA-binding transcriptional ArsR family regulator